MKVKLTGEEYQELVDKYDKLCELIIERTQLVDKSDTYNSLVAQITIPLGELPNRIIHRIRK